MVEGPVLCVPGIVLFPPTTFYCRFQVVNQDFWLCFDSSYQDFGLEVGKGA